MLREPAFDKAPAQAGPLADGMALGTGTVSRVLVSFALAVALSFALFNDAWLAMARVWMNSETYTHGFIAVPFSAWMIWRNRGDWAASPTRIWWPGLLAVAACSVLWVLGRLAGVASLEQFGAVALIPAAMAVTVGRPIVGALAFPLAFLFFAVPVGDFLTPIMMDYTADATVAALQWTGVPVYREGLHFMVPTGRWSVVEACSGLRYLIASLALGVLYAYLQFRTLKYRLAFMALSLIVPIVANWVRAYLIVMIGHLSDMKLAAGADHLIYGWVFFGFVMGLLFWIGSRWREPEPGAGSHEARGAFADLGASTGNGTGTGTGTGTGIGTGTHRPAGRSHGRLVVAALAVVALASLARPLAASLLDATEPVAIAGPIRAATAPIAAEAEAGGVAGDAAAPDSAPSGAEHLPAAAGSPAAVRSSFGWAPVFTEASDVASLRLAIEGHRVDAHVFYYARQHERKEMIHNDHHVVRVGDRLWPLLGHGYRAVPWGRVVESRIGHPGRELLVWHWYQVAGRVTPSPYMAKALTGLALLAGRGDHSLTLALATPIDKAGTDGLRQARRVLEGAAQRIVPAATLLSRGQTDSR